MASTSLPHGRSRHPCTLAPRDVRPWFLAPLSQWLTYGHCYRRHDVPSSPWDARLSLPPHAYPKLYSCSLRRGPTPIALHHDTHTHDPSYVYVVRAAQGRCCSNILPSQSAGDLCMFVCSFGVFVFTVCVQCTHLYRPDMCVPARVQRFWYAALPWNAPVSSFDRVRAHVEVISQIHTRVIYAMEVPRPTASCGRQLCPHESFGRPEQSTDVREACAGVRMTSGDVYISTSYIMRSPRVPRASEARRRAVVDAVGNGPDHGIGDILL
ncbi:hypothetical protein BC628DRAFT_21539 [Trametes gibbosa]|nr:hypothetical protein BC628DRAFT_21539 [Trametes gibbosa]